MSFNFNWSPLIADTSRAKEMLTAALNKSPKPPIIVDDIVVSELNLGETPPDLEILEIGDLAEDRFRGIFKMSYTGDAFLTLKTRVQANPLNTYLSMKPSFASPQPLAAASGLTIPLAITLSDIRLSGFVILVFSKHKGMTLVFRNDPLESLKVSSTFDSIPFVRDYLQREIEKQLRNLFMEDLPAILHKLSLRLWSPEYREMDDRLLDAEEDKTIPIDPLASPPQDPSDWLNIGSESVPSFSLDASDTHASFSQKNLHRLAALSDSHRTLSLVTPTIQDAVFRAWAGASERGSSGLQTPVHTILPTLSRTGSYLSSAASTSSVLSDPASDTYSRTSTSYTFHGTTSRYGHRPRKAKKRVINLRKQAMEAEAQSTPTSASTTPEPSIAPSSAPSVIYEEDQEDQLTTPPRTPLHPPRRHRSSSLDTPDATPRASLILPKKEKAEYAPPAYAPPTVPLHLPTKKEKTRTRPPPISSQTFPAPFSSASSSADMPSLLRTLSSERMAFGQPPGLTTPFSPSESSASSGGILEQAWMMKIARDIGRKLEEERRRKEEGLVPPPAYAA